MLNDNATAPTPTTAADEQAAQPLTAERNIERYDLSTDYGIAQLAPHATGTWVMYAQHLSMLAGVQAALLAARRETEDRIWRAYRLGYVDGITLPISYEELGYEKMIARAEAGASAHVAALAATPETRSHA